MDVNFSYQVGAVIDHACPVGWTDVGEIAAGVSTNRKELVHNVKMSCQLYGHSNIQLVIKHILQLLNI